MTPSEIKLETVKDIKDEMARVYTESRTTMETSIAKDWVGMLESLMKITELHARQEFMRKLNEPSQYEKPKLVPPRVAER